MKRTSVRYGHHHAQVCDLWQPEDGPGEHGVVALFHGGFWRQLYTKRLMHRLARVVVEHGWAAYNVEYRRTGRLGSGGWPETFEDVAAAMNTLAQVEGIDNGRIVTCGHSAGGHLALWAASSRPTTLSPSAEPVRVRAAVSLAGVVDLVAAARLGLGGGAVQALMGGDPDEYPDRYALGSPASLLPFGVPQILVHGLEDTTVPPSFSADYVERAVAAGDQATFVPVAGAGHMEMIDPHGAAAAQLVGCLAGFRESG